MARNRQVARRVGPLAALAATLAAVPALAQNPLEPNPLSPYYSPEASPSGANHFDCMPSAAHPNPVILVHGLGANMAENWSYVSPALAADGYCVFALTYGQTETNPYPFDQPGGTRPMEQSALVLKAFAERVLEATRARKVDVVGHSEGSLMPNHWIKFLGGAAVVDRYVGLTPLWDGTNLAMSGTLYAAGRDSGQSGEVSRRIAENGCGSCPQFVKGSDFLNAMNDGRPATEGRAAVPGVTYTMIMTRNDESVSPYTSGYLYALNATNIVIQDKCALDPSEHAAVAFNPLVLQLIRNALDPAHATEVSCASYQF